MGMTKFLAVFDITVIFIFVALGLVFAFSEGKFRLSWLLLTIYITAFITVLWRLA